jgi:tetratricopeptide (TPR) repeat protein
MKRCIYFIVLSVILSFTGCSFFPGEIKTAERLIENTPDSALKILQRIPYDKSLSSADRALYGLLLFEALDKAYKPLQPDSVINFSIEYYNRKNNSEKLAKAYFYKARVYKYAYQFEDASNLYMTALDNLKKSEDYNLLAKIYSDLGDICIFQNELEDARSKFEKAIVFFEKAKKENQALLKHLDIGKSYRIEKKYSKAKETFISVINKTKDSLLIGIAIQEIGANFFISENYDSAIHYLKKSIKYPFMDKDQSIRHFLLSDSYYMLKEGDSAIYYANKALEFPANFFTQRECYRILANTMYLQGDYKAMAGYMTKFQACSDSVRKIEAQTKSTIIENIHFTKETVSKTRRWLVVSIALTPLILLIALIIYFRLRKKSEGTEEELVQKSVQLEEIEHKIQLTTEQLKDNLLFKIEEARKKNRTTNKKVSINERMQLDKAAYTESLHLDNPDSFDRLMDFNLNQLVRKLNDLKAELNHKDIVYCCLCLLEIPTADIVMLLDLQLSSLYKLKQRLAQKLSLKSSTDILPFLKELWLQ